MPDWTADKIGPDEFESSVRHVARQLYRHGRATGSVLLDGRERDEIIDTGTELIIVEATTSKKLSKTEHDLKKSIDLVKSLRGAHRFLDYNFRIILVTAEDPTASQSEHVKSSKSGCPKEIISFAELFSRLFDARHYIRVRGDHTFGSVRNPANELDYKVPASDYIATALSREGDGETTNAAGLADRLQSGGRYVIYGDYGSGKSMTLRDVYFRMRDGFAAGKHLCCPVYLNLREHIAQNQPDEALYRHAEKVGFPNTHSLISAWRSGFVALFLDGFDELTPPQFASSISNLRQARRFAVELVRRFIEQTPPGAPVIVAGRESYFDSRDEARGALGYDRATQVFDLAGFSDADIGRFLKVQGAHLPSWLPTRPLLLGYLANSGLLKSDDGLLALSPSRGWDQILQRVCSREVSQVWGVGFEANDLRRFIEGLATRARKARDGKGLEDSDLKSVFREVFGRDADEPANLLALRLPGLGSVPGRPGAREFIDADFAEAAGSGDLNRFIDSPFDAGSPLNGVQVALGSLGREMASTSASFTASKICIALSQSSRRLELATTSEDLISILMDWQVGYSGDDLTIAESNFDLIHIDPELDFSRVTFVRCIVGTLEIGRSIVAQNSSRFPRFHDCLIDKLFGATSEKDVPEGVLTGSTSVENYASFTPTNDAVMRSTLPSRVKVLLTILRKLFMQSGSGRQYSALKRGLPTDLVGYVDEIVALIKSEAYAEDVYVDRRTILVPIRSRSNDALAIINGPNTSTHSLIEKVRCL